MVLTQDPPDFNNPTQQIKLNPQTTVVFEDGPMVTLQHHAAAESVRIEYDILLILYPMVNWTTVGELCLGWPPADQEKIKAHLVMLHQSKIVITPADQSNETGESDSSLPQELGNNIVINVDNHVHMLRDSIRTLSYRRAIEKAVTPDSVVMDLGAGSGILSFFAAKAGAKKVYAIEKRPDMVMISKEIAKANGLFDKIEWLEKSSQTIQPQSVDPKPTVFVSEILGNAILEENILEFTLDARDRLIAPGATLIPHAVELCLVGFDSGIPLDKTQEVDELEDIYGFNFQCLKNVMGQKPSIRLERFNFAGYRVMTPPQTVKYLDLNTLTDPHFEEILEVIPTDDGHLNGFCLYFKAHLDAETALTNSPWAPPTHWTQMMFHYPERVAVKAGQPVSLTLRYDGNLSLWFN